MAGIIGPTTYAHSNVHPLEAHVSHLRHLTNVSKARELLAGRFGLDVADARNAAKSFSAHVRQSLEFHNESLRASLRIRPVLQYYSYLNLAVAAILAYRPSNFQQHQSHGVQDRTLGLKRLNFGSEVVRVSQGAIPLFHSIISDASLVDRTFRFGQLAAGIQMLTSELTTEFSKNPIRISVSDQVVNDSGTFLSRLTFTIDAVEQEQAISSKKLEDAMPLLGSAYDCPSNSTSPLIYSSRQQWSTEEEATKVHRKNCLKLINYGGHRVSISPLLIQCFYEWHGLPRIPLLPTLTSLLLLSFSLASIVRYRPILLESALSSPVHLLMDTFVQESDALFIPALRNLLYREEMYIGISDLI